jgi:hypothetical protein
MLWESDAQLVSDVRLRKDVRVVDMRRSFCLLRVRCVTDLRTAVSIPTERTRRPFVYVCGTVMLLVHMKPVCGTVMLLVHMKPVTFNNIAHTTGRVFPDTRRFRYFFHFPRVYYNRPPPLPQIISVHRT